VDISDRVDAEKKLRQSEECYRLLVASAREYAIIMVGVTGEVLTWNNGAERLFGYSAPEIVGRGISAFFSEEDRANRVLETEMEAAARDGHASNEGWRIRKDGSRFWGSGAMEPLFVDGVLRGFSKVLRDNTERRQAEQTLSEMNSSLEQRVEKATSRLREMTALVTMAEHRERNRISEMLHDGLQQLLYSVQVKLMLRRQVAGPGELAALDEAQRGIEKAVKTARELSVDLSPQVLDTEGLAEALAWLAGQMNSLYGLEVDIDAGTTSPIETPVRVLLFQAVRELLFNIVKHADTKRAWINMFQHAGELLIRVRDKGCGFDLDDQPKFGGLSVEHRLFLVGGAVEVKSKPGRGTTVTIRFPLEQDEVTSGY
jgi:PAS domain S-box-containing protein